MTDHHAAPNDQPVTEDADAVDDTSALDTARRRSELTDIRDRAASLPWWRRPRRLRRQLAWTLAATALASVLLVGGLNYVAARQLLDDGTRDQLVGVGQARARTIETGVDRLLGQVSAVSGDLGVVQALETFNRDFATLQNEELTDGQLAELEAFYQEQVVDLYAALGLDPVTVDDFLPSSDAGKYLQYHYTVTPAMEDVEARSVVDAGDGSAYSETHARLHPSLERMFGFTASTGDALLVNVDGDVVYSVDKRIDVGTNLQDGPYADSQLAETIRTRLARQRSGTALLADLELYAPVQGRPVFFATAAVKNDTEPIGVVAVEVPVEALSALTTTNGRWEEFGLRSGESYVVGGDLRLRSESRLWIEDPEEYLDRVDGDERAPLIALLGSPVGLQEVDTQPVREALNGDEFRGSSDNYLGVSNFSYSQPVAFGGVDMVIVVDIPLSDARAPLLDYARRLGLVLLVILPSAALVGIWLARRLTRPIPLVLDAANSIVDGERTPDLPDLGRDEFGDLARRLGYLAEQLGEREQALAQEYDDRRELMLSVLPPRLVDADGNVSPVGDLADLATAVAVTVDASTDDLIDDDERQADLLDQVAAVAEEVTERYTVERVRAFADGYLYLIGVGVADDGADEALGFLSELLRGFVELRQREDVDIQIRMGAATGPVGTGVLESGGITYGAWGLPIRQAAALAAMALPGRVLIDASTASAASSSDQLVAADDVIDLDGESMELYTVVDGATSGTT